LQLEQRTHKPSGTSILSLVEVVMPSLFLLNHAIISIQRVDVI